MRWTRPEYGDTKIETIFPIIPIKIDRETRWLEWTTILYTYKLDFYDHHGYWLPTEFIDNVKEGVSKNE